MKHALLTVLLVACAMTRPLKATVSESRCGWCDVMLLAPKEAATDTQLDFFWSQGESETNNIDVLLVFDKTAKNWLFSNGYSDCEDFANEAIIELNAGLANTGLDKYFTFRLAGAGAVGVNFNKYTAARLASKVATMQGLTETERSVIQRIRDARDATKADLVALLSDGFEGDSFGAGMMLSSLFWNATDIETYKDMPYCAVSISAIQERYTLMHELGHLMGAGHADSIIPILSPGPQLFDYSSGYYFWAGGIRYATVMSSEWDGYNEEDAVRLPVFSSPEYTMLVKDGNGGIVDSGIAAGSALHDNTTTLRRTYPIVANFRVAKMLDKLPNDFDSIDISARTPTADVGEGSLLKTKVGIMTRVKLTVSSPLKTILRVTGLPVGLSFDEAKGLIYGIPRRTGNYDVAITASNATKTRVFKFRVTVTALPDWAVGTYYGWASWEGAYVPVKIMTTNTGKLKGAFNAAGRNIFFTSTHYLDDADDDKGETSLAAYVNVKVGVLTKRTIMLNLRRADFPDRSGAMLARGIIEFGGIESEILEDLWADDRVSPVKVARKCIVSMAKDVGGNTGLGANDKMKFMIAPGGIGKFKGEISGSVISGSARFARLGAERGSTSIELLQMPVIVKPANYSALANSYAAVANFRIAIDGDSGVVLKMKLVSLDALNGITTSK